VGGRGCVTNELLWHCLFPGTWRLIYSSGFNNGSLGGSRPGPPAAFVPLILGQVYQVINTREVSLPPPHDMPLKREEGLGQGIASGNWWHDACHVLLVADASHASWELPAPCLQHLVVGMKNAKSADHFRLSQPSCVTLHMKHQLCLG
jgi:hypothetical protein